ncbi:MAG TPA: FliH/SctL family protein [Candidatus Sulfopaludibacter sp.]|nr:FliH/SctL family protein [Candidatus Sulfopaludibacter sp.]
MSDSGEPAACGRAVEEPEQRQDAASQARRENELRECFEQGRARGFDEGRAAEREALTASIEAREAAQAQQCVRLLEQFHAERDRYFEAVEPQVVRLALAVAARILRREAQMDPLLLSGAVRVALGQLSASTAVRLRAPAADLELWSDAIAHLPNLAPRPTVVAGEDMRLGECVLETELGKVDLGIAPQLAEIERGFFDRAGPNPPVEMPTTIREDMEE